jgi:hypothetical protein
MAAGMGECIWVVHMQGFIVACDMSPAPQTPNSDHSSASAIASALLNSCSHV